MAQQEHLPIHIWWDLESVKFNGGFDPFRSYAAIKSAMTTLGFPGNIEFIRAYAVTNTFPTTIISRLIASGMIFEELTVPLGIVPKNSQTVDDEIKSVVTEWLIQMPMPYPAVTVIMSCDKGYIDIIKGLEENNFTTCLIYAEGTCTSEHLPHVPMHSLRWVEDVMEKSPLVDPTLYGLDPYGPKIFFEASPSLIALHPLEHSVAVAVGWELRVFDLVRNRPVTFSDESARGFHNDSIRAIRYSASGKIFVSGGNDKRVKIWSTESWQCLNNIPSKKAVIAVAITSDDCYVCYADTLGVVYVVELNVINGDKVLPTAKEIGSKLYHENPIITSLDFSPDNRYILSAHGNYKIRVTVFPKKPLDKNNERTSFYVGHEK